MISDLTYRKAFLFAVTLHLFLLVLLFTDNSSKRPVLTMESKNSPGMMQPTASQQEVVKAVSVDNKEIMKTVNRLKQEREQQKKAELNRQKELLRQAEAAKQQRIKEQQEIARLKEEANKIAIARKKQVEEEKKRLKELAEQKALEAKRIEELKKQNEKLAKQRELEAKKLAELNKKKQEEKEKAEKLKAEQAKAEKLKAEQARAEQEKAEMERKRQAEAAAAQQAAQNAERQARIAGEVDKYKALIVNAIGRNWILPENVDSSLSSQFRIRLAPDGTVLEVSLIRSSGDPLLDRSAQTAIYKASPLPVPQDVETFNLFRDISLTVRPEQVRG
ncbi:TPA: cell envelope integrity protein TolA [Legionella pneumophila]|uniref:Cell envelope integrity protein TolA n=1 Tax=Legionella pneumophila subsp. pneumophila TaxID=91891 RepID=A0A3A6ULC3_LEGPN|nr:cell envelope integrity protein TolA [Legionella pneumophila]ERH42521.1 cell envelope biogenesis protein TonB [Legionella pneumophila str. Leg01/11]ERH46497.1 cell envelope biogenesis protein TonB [Legionella pneumophila str. Leg01/53]ERI46488.1 cell envelope biogenesis protein TonB [Legionella pneumophila str. Leg01/20]ANN95599.1 protein TolA [Legionella pneumophila]ERB41490.1 cell envelope biogenesis protein TonB [Legionella pneumophila str. 121004]